jgi:3-phosphoshikimate 1-carboxyvinyltransferase
MWEVLRLRRCEPLRAAVRVPGDKSISHRALILAAVAKGETSVANLNLGRDVRATVDCLRQMGIEIEAGPASVRISGGEHKFAPPKAPLCCANSGTTMRLLCGLLSTMPFASVLTGDESLSKRDMKRVVEPLTKMGALIAATDGRRAPLKITGRPLHGARYEMPFPSAQVKGALILAALRARGETTIIEPVKTRDHTERIVEMFGGIVFSEDYRQGASISIPGNQTLVPADVNVPGDFSTAVFLFIPALFTAGSKLTVKSVGVNPTRTHVLRVLERMGANVSVVNVEEGGAEPIGDVVIESGSLAATRVSAAETAFMIDEIPALAVIVSQASGATVIEGCGELRQKETDRITAIVENLRAFGGKIDVEGEDIHVFGPTKLTGAKVNSFGDHRVAMAFGMAGMIADGETVVPDPDVADISAPGFWDILPRA